MKEPLSSLQQAFDEGFEAVKAYLDHEIKLLEGKIEASNASTVKRLVALEKKGKA